MKIRFIRPLLLSIFSLALVFTLSISSAAAADGRYVILMKGDKISKNLSKDIKAAGGELVRTIPEVGIAIATSPDLDFADNAMSIRGVVNTGPVGAWSIPDEKTYSPIVANPDGPTIDDEYYLNGWLWGIDRVHAADAWDNGHTGSHETVVAVVDTGVAWNHPDLAPNIVSAKCITSAMPCNPYPASSNHGTHVAGTIAAAFGQLSIVGVAPETGIAAYNVFEDITGCGHCAYSDSRWEAMIDAAESGYQVISMSLGGYVSTGGQGSNGAAAYLQAEKKVANYVKKLGTLMVASAGNGNVDLNGRLSHVPGDIPQMVNVSATGIQPVPRYPADGNYDIRAFYSNYGAAVDIAGPGGDCGQVGKCTGEDVNGYWYGEFLIWSTVAFVDPVCAATYDCPLGYGGKGGTSMATPHVSGVAALIYDANPGIGPGEVKDILKSSAEKIGDRQSFGAGMVRADNATQ